MITTEPKDSTLVDEVVNYYIKNFSKYDQFDHTFLSYPEQPYLELYNKIVIFRGYELGIPVEKFPVIYDIYDPNTVIKGLLFRNYSEDLTILGVGENVFACVQLYPDLDENPRISYYRWISTGEHILRDGTTDLPLGGFPSRKANHLVTPENFEILKAPLLLCNEAFRLLDEQDQILAANCIPGGQ